VLDRKRDSFASIFALYCARSSSTFTVCRRAFALPGALTRFAPVFPLAAFSALFFALLFLALPLVANAVYLTV
jgi:hypothetical protein